MIVESWLEKMWGSKSIEHRGVFNRALSMCYKNNKDNWLHFTDKILVWLNDVTDEVLKSRRWGR